MESKNSRILCLLCTTNTNREDMATNNVLIQHLRNRHNVLIEEEKLTFSNFKDFENWKQLEHRNVDYISGETRKEGYKNVILYNCNRSNSEGFKSNASNNTDKKGASIKIDGMCPSRITADFYFDGKVEVHYVKTHVGHEEKLRARLLTPKEQKIIVEKLKAGVSVDRIMEDSQKLQDEKLEPRNAVIKEDLGYINKEYGIEHSRDPNDLLAIAKQVKKWNFNDENYERLFKEIGLLLKGNSIKGLEPLLNTCDKAMHNKIWNIINQTFRPHSTYQDRQITKVHKRAQEQNWKDDVMMIELGKFQIKSSSGEQFYSVEYGNELCDCVGLLCRVCKICKHKYKCNCVQYTVKNTMCEHVHMVSLYEGEVLAESVKEMESKKSDYLCSKKVSKEKLKLKEVENEFMNEKYQELNDKENHKEIIDEEARRKILLQDYINKLNTLMNLDTTTFNKLFEKLNTDINKLLPNTATKRKIEKQSDYPQTQKKQRKQ